MAKHRLPELIENTGEICEYGCGGNARYKLLNGKWCCSERYHKCPVKRNVQSIAQKGRDDLIKQGKRLSKARKFVRTIEYIKDKYPLFYKTEELRYLPGTKVIQVRCKNSKCNHSKDKDGWFTPTSRQLEKRIERIERQGIDGSYFYCSNICKQTCSIFNKTTAQLIKEDQIRAGYVEDPWYTSKEYGIWKKYIFFLDNDLCVYCGNLAEHAHHILPQKIYPNLALDPDNGIACCSECHYKHGHRDKECTTGFLSQLTCERIIRVKEKV